MQSIGAQQGTTGLPVGIYFSLQGSWLVTSDNPFGLLRHYVPAMTSEAWNHHGVLRTVHSQ